MSAVRDTIHVNVEYFDGQDEGDTGTPYYVASCVEITASTDGATFDEVVKNIAEVIVLTLKNIDTVAEYNLIAKPKIIVKMELPDYSKT